VEISEHIAALSHHGELLAEAAAAAGLATGIPACPGWQVRDLVRHQAYVHGWAARHLTERPAQVIREADEAAVLAGGPADDELIGAYRAGLARLVAALGGADPAIRCPAFLPAPSPLAFWARRQAHETAIHRFDAQSARREGPPDPREAFPPDFAIDGIDELITGFAARPRRNGPGRTLLVRATTQSATPEATETAVTGAWHYTWPADGRVAARRLPDSAVPDSAMPEAAGPGDRADCVVSGPPSGVYLFLWNRAAIGEAGITVSGDSSVLDAWRSSIHIRWS
jgi:uncharacterized protein (TIGR03083 family)